MKGAISLSGKGLMPPISLPADFTTRIHSYTKIVIPVDLASGPESGGAVVAQAESIPGVEWKGLVVKMIQ